MLDPAEAVCYTHNMVTDGLKHCPHCKQTQSTDNFYRVKRKSGDGFSGYCKPCTAQRAMAWQKNNPEADAAIRAARLDKIKKERKSWSEEKKAQIRTNSLNWRRRNPEKAKEVQRLGKQRERAKDVVAFRGKASVRLADRRSRKLGYPSDFTETDWTRLLEAFDNSCAYCGAKAKLLDLEHVVPFNLGGYNVVGNIVPACTACNTKKNSKHPKMFADLIGIDLTEVIKRAAIRYSACPLFDSRYYG